MPQINRGSHSSKMIWQRITEHAENVMMFSFNVARNPEPVR